MIITITLIDDENLDVDGSNYNSSASYKANADEYEFAHRVLAGEMQEDGIAIAERTLRDWTPRESFLESTLRQLFEDGARFEDVVKDVKGIWGRLEGVHIE